MKCREIVDGQPPKKKKRVERIGAKYGHARRVEKNLAMKIVLECERCEGHRCAKCLKLTDEAYEVLTSRSDFHWLCGGCEPKVLHTIQLEKEIEANLSYFMSKWVTN